MNNLFAGKIVTNPKVVVGKPIIKGTRITVERILTQLAQGITVEEILENYPTLTKSDIQAAIAYAGNMVAREAVYPMEIERV